MARYIREEMINKPQEFVDFIMQDFLTKHNFSPAALKGEQIYQDGIGMVSIPRFFKYYYVNGVIHLEAWTRTAWLPGVYGRKENDLRGYVGSIPKQAYRNDIEELLRVLKQPLPSDNLYMNSYYGQPGANQNGYYGQPGMNQNGYYDQPGANQNGYYGQPGMNQNGYYDQPGANQNGYYGQPGMNQNGYYDQPGLNQNSYYNQGNNNFNPNPYQQNKSIVVKGVDTKNLVTVGFVFSLLAIPIGLLNLYLGFVFALVGTSYSYKGLSSTKRKMANMGFIIGIVDLIVIILGFITLFLPK